MKAANLARVMLPALLVMAVVLIMARSGASGTVAPEVDLTGRWNFLMLGGAFTTACEVQFTQSGSDVDADWICQPDPAEFTGTIKDVNGTNELVLDGAIPNYVIHIEATVSQDGNSADGTWETNGSVGDFSADRKLAATTTPTPSRTPTAPPATNTPPPPTASATQPTATATQPPAPTPTSAALTPTPHPLFGDVNCDGVVNSVDATLILQFVAGLIDSLPCMANADVNHDGLVNSLDAAIVLQFVAGLLTDIG